MLSKRKKIIVLVGMVSLLVLTGCLNIFLNKSTKKVEGGNEITYESLFASYRAERTSTRESTMLYLDSIINNQASTAEAKATAEANKEQIIKNMELELVLEGLIKSIGFDDAFVTNSTQNMNVIIKQEVLTEVEANKILDVILRETDKEATSVIIIPLK